MTGTELTDVYYVFQLWCDYPILHNGKHVYHFNRGLYRLAGNTLWVYNAWFKVTLGLSYVYDVHVYLLTIMRHWAINWNIEGSILNIHSGPCLLSYLTCVNPADVRSIYY